MKIDFVVHTAVEGPVAVDAIVEGQKMTASVPGLEVELTTVVSRHGTLTLRFAGQELPAAKELFQVDRKITFVAAPTPEEKGRK